MKSSNIAFALLELRDAQECLFAAATELHSEKADPVADQAASLAIQIQSLIDVLKARKPS